MCPKWAVPPLPRPSSTHANSGIPNNAFYLLSEGGKNRTQDLYGKDSAEAKKVLESWSAVGVG